MLPFKNSADFEHLISGMVKAGFKGNLSDYPKIGEKDKLIEEEIKELLFGRIISGFSFGGNWSHRIHYDGIIEWLGLFDKNVDTGCSWIENDEICIQFENEFDGLKYCSKVYKNPEGDKIKTNEYILLTDFWILPFSIEK